MSKRTTPAKSAATKRAAFAGQRQQFAAKGRAKSFGLAPNERNEMVRYLKLFGLAAAHQAL
jgi:hypothetical protein